MSSVGLRVGGEGKDKIQRISQNSRVCYLRRSADIYASIGFQQKKPRV